MFYIILLNINLRFNIYIIKIGLFEIKVKELSENFNTVYILRKSVEDTYKKYKDCVTSYENFMNNKVKKWY